MKRLLWAVPAAVLLALASIAAAQSGPVPRFFGPVNQDGCPFCCEFNCQLTPTPTPEMDGQGRQVFRRRAGEFLLVVEAGPGLSNRQPGSEGVVSGNTVQPIFDISGRPSVQILSKRDLGNGTLAVDCRTIPLGGVKGFFDLDFNASSDVTTALIDMACHFELATTTAVACTRDRYGNFAFLSSGTSRQFCFQVPNVAAFPLGDTILALLLRDTNGNLGPRREVVIRVEPDGGQVASSTPTPSPTPTPTAASIVGRLRYYSGDRSVSGATMQLGGGALQSMLSTTSGTYGFPSLVPGYTTVEPRKVGDFGSPNAVTALDASWVLQTVAGTRTFTDNQRLACDVTGNGTLSALDATRILQRQVGLLPRFAVSDQCDSDWLFKPSPGTAVNQRLIQPLISTGMCRRGAIAFEPLVGVALQQDFVAILFGDCTGNWQPAATGASLRARAVATAPHTLRVRSARPAGGGTLRLPVAVKGSDPYYSLDLTLTYDSDTLTPTDVRTLRAAGDAMIVSNLTQPGVVRIAVASAVPMPSGVSVIAADFAGTGSSNAVAVTRALVDDIQAPLE